MNSLFSPLKVTTRKSYGRCQVVFVIDVCKGGEEKITAVIAKTLCTLKRLYSGYKLVFGFALINAASKKRTNGVFYEFSPTSISQVHSALLEEKNSCEMGSVVSEAVEYTIKCALGDYKWSGSEIFSPLRPSPRRAAKWGINHEKEKGPNKNLMFLLCDCPLTESEMVDFTGVDENAFEQFFLAKPMLSKQFSKASITLHWMDLVPRCTLQIRASSMEVDVSRILMDNYNNGVVVPVEMLRMGAFSLTFERLLCHMLCQDKGERLQKRDEKKEGSGNDSEQDDAVVIGNDECLYSLELLKLCDASEYATLLATVGPERVLTSLRRGSMDDIFYRPKTTLAIAKLLVVGSENQMVYGLLEFFTLNMLYVRLLDPATGEAIEGLEPLQANHSAQQVIDYLPHGMDFMARVEENAVVFPQQLEPWHKAPLLIVPMADTRGMIDTKGKSVKLTGSEDIDADLKDAYKSATREGHHVAEFLCTPAKTPKRSNISSATIYYNGDGVEIGHISLLFKNLRGAPSDAIYAGPISRILGELASAQPTKDAAESRLFYFGLLKSCYSELASFGSSKKEKSFENANLVQLLLYPDVWFVKDFLVAVMTKIEGDGGDKKRKKKKRKVPNELCEEDAREKMEWMDTCQMYVSSGVLKATLAFVEKELLVKLSALMEKYERREQASGSGQGNIRDQKLLELKMQVLLRLEVGRLKVWGHEKWPHEFSKGTVLCDPIPVKLIKQIGKFIGAMSFILDSQQTGGVSKYLYRAVFMCFYESIPLSVKALYKRFGRDVPLKEVEEKKGGDEEPLLENLDTIIEEEPLAADDNKMSLVDEYVPTKENDSLKALVGATRSKRFSGGMSLRIIQAGQQKKNKKRKGSTTRAKASVLGSKNIIVAETPARKAKTRYEEDGKTLDLLLDDDGASGPCSFSVKRGKFGRSNVISQKFAVLADERSTSPPNNTRRSPWKITPQKNKSGENVIIKSTPTSSRKQKLFANISNKTPRHGQEVYIPDTPRMQKKVSPISDKTFRFISSPLKKSSIRSSGSEGSSSSSTKIVRKSARRLQLPPP
eukprot:Nk52_evm7s293 gene=Nk52_evmTU7s293